MKDHTIRKASPDDAALIQSLALQVFPQTYGSILSQEQISYMMEWMYAPANIRQQMQEGHSFYLLHIHGQPAGYASIEQQAPDLFHLHKLYILPEYHKMHLGKVLFEHIVTAVKTVHPTSCRIELNVNRHNSAIGFYEHMGMHRDRQGDFDIGNGFFMNDYIMALEV